MRDISDLIKLGLWPVNKKVIGELELLALGYQMFYEGKNADMYFLPNKTSVLMVRTDRTSVNDILLSDVIEGKGEIQNKISNFGYDFAEKILEHLNGLVGIPFKVRVINVDENGKKIIFSEKAAIEEDRSKALASLKEGDIVEGVVSGILSYGLFVTFAGLEGLVHVSEIDWGHVTDPSKFAKVGMTVKVKVIGLESEKISLSIKRLKENPWDVLAKKFKLNDSITAPISRISKFGAFMDLEGGIQGLIHLSEISHGVVKDIRDHVKVGEEVTAKIINFEPTKKRIGLSLKALQEAPKETPKKVVAKKETEEKESK